MQLVTMAVVYVSVAALLVPYFSLTLPYSPVYRVPADLQKRALEVNGRRASEADAYLRSNAEWIAEELYRRLRLYSNSQSTSQPDFCFVVVTAKRQVEGLFYLTQILAKLVPQVHVRCVCVWCVCVSTCVYSIVSVIVYV